MDEHKKPDESVSSGTGADFVHEKIKKRPLDKRKLARRTIITVTLALVFGLVACATFLGLEPLMRRYLFPSKESEQPSVAAPSVVLPDASVEMRPEDMVGKDDTESVREIVRSTILEDDSIRRLLEKPSAQDLDQEDFLTLYGSLSEYARSLSVCMTMVTGVTSDTDWLEGTLSQSGRVPGLVVASNGMEYFILTYAAPLVQAQSVSVIIGGTQYAAEVRETDAQTGLCVVAVEAEGISASDASLISIAALGSSTAADLVGSPVIALGSPAGPDSLVYGMVTGMDGIESLVDANYHVLSTDIYGSIDARGVLFNLRGQAVGIIAPGAGDDSMPNAVAALGITDLRRLIERMCNDRTPVYAGVRGMDVTQSVHESAQMPYGAYVSEVIVGSPAMVAGIKRGDVIVSLGEPGDMKSIASFEDYTAALSEYEVAETVSVIVSRQGADGYRNVTVTLKLASSGIFTETGDTA